MSFCSAGCLQVKDMRTGGLQRDNLSFYSLCLLVSSRLCCPAPTKQTHRSDDPGLRVLLCVKLHAHKTQDRLKKQHMHVHLLTDVWRRWGLVFKLSGHLSGSSLRFSWLSRPQAVERGGQGVVLWRHTQTKSPWRHEKDKKSSNQSSRD